MDFDSIIKGSMPLPPAKKKHKGEENVRTLVFNVKNQIIQKEPSCDFSGLVANTSGYLKAKFVLSDAWDNCAKVAGFFSKDDQEFPPCVLDENNSCEIPSDALKYHEFKIRLYGKRDNYMITTQPITIKQYGGIK